MSWKNSKFILLFLLYFNFL